jgi:UDP-N-acetylmuramoyl-L-alanyl-D-glutamate--2,6-diaminopimelate ligase
VVYGRNLRASIHGLEFDVEFESKRAKFKTELLGEFNAYNLLAVLATLLASGFNLADAVQSLQQVQSVVGRMEKLGGGNLPLVVIDFAHTPDALEKILIALRGILLRSKATSKLKTQNPRLICVFGCGGDRDRGKRALMGKVATQLSDEVIITSDNPRSEDPDAIINEIVSGANANHHIEENRAAAIYQAVYGARKGDVVLIAGKGHEVYQEIGGQRFPFSDVKVAQQILQNLMARAQV